MISIFCERIPHSMPVGIYGDGGQTRDFIHVSDVVAALLAGIRHRFDMATVLNVCTGEATSISELARVIGTLARTPPEVRHLPPRSGGIRHSLGDPTEMRRVLSLGPAVTLRDGLETLLADHDAPNPA